MTNTVTVSVSTPSDRFPRLGFGVDVWSATVDAFGSLRPEHCAVSVDHNTNEAMVLRPVTGFPPNVWPMLHYGTITVE